MPENAPDFSLRAEDLENTGRNLEKYLYTFPPERIAAVWNLNSPRQRISSWFGPCFHWGVGVPPALEENLRRFLVGTSSAAGRGHPSVSREDLDWLLNKVYFRLDALAQDSGVFYPEVYSRDLDEICYQALRGWREHFGLE